MPSAGTHRSLCWQGNKDFPGDRDRSIALKKFEKLFEREGVQFVSLQKGYGEQQIKENNLQGRIIDWTNEMDTGPDAFVDMAAFMKNLNLVISVDPSSPIWQEPWQCRYGCSCRSFPTGGGSGLVVRY